MKNINVIAVNLFGLLMPLRSFASTHVQKFVGSDPIKQYGVLITPIDGPVWLVLVFVFLPLASLVFVYYCQRLQQYKNLIFIASIVVSVIIGMLYRILT